MKLYSYCCLVIQGEENIITKRVHTVVIIILGINIQALPFRFIFFFFTAPEGILVSLVGFLLSYL